MSAAVRLDRQLLLRMNPTFSFLTDPSEGQLPRMCKGNHRFWSGGDSLGTESNVASDRFCSRKVRIHFQCEPYTLGDAKPVLERCKMN